MAQLEETISKLPEKVNGIIGENGYKLSGGERQRVAIARHYITIQISFLMKQLLLLIKIPKRKFLMLLKTLKN